MTNYDIHWNPVRLMQRIGRVDRRMDPAIEKRLVADHPEAAASRDKVWFWNFLPPEELNEILSLYTKVTQKTLLISKTLGIEGKKLLTPEDDYEALKEFHHAYEGTRTAMEDMHLEYQALAPSRSGTGGAPRSLPRCDLQRPQAPGKGRARCLLLLRAPRPRQGRRTSSPWRPAPPAGTSTTSTAGPSLEEPGVIVASIRSKPEMPRRCTTEEEDAPRHPQADREAHQEQLPEARGRPRRRQAAASLLAGTERGLNRCRPTTAHASPASAASTSSSPTCATSSAGLSTRTTSNS